MEVELEQRISVEAENFGSGGMAQRNRMSCTSSSRVKQKIPKLLHIEKQRLRLNVLGWIMVGSKRGRRPLISSWCPSYLFVGVDNVVKRERIKTHYFHTVCVRVSATATVILCSFYFVSSSMLSHRRISAGSSCQDRKSLITCRKIIVAGRSTSRYFDRYFYLYHCFTNTTEV